MTERNEATDVDGYVTYECPICGQKKRLKAGETQVCCKPVMSPPEPCTRDQAWAEHARPMEDEGPCDDGRSG